MNNERIPIIEKSIEVIEEGIEKYNNLLKSIQKEIDLNNEQDMVYLEQQKFIVSKKIDKLILSLKDKKESK